MDRLATVVQRTNIRFVVRVVLLRCHAEFRPFGFLFSDPGVELFKMLLDRRQTSD